MAPINVGFIGLSAKAGWAPGAHLPYLQKSDQYQIVAVQNSTVESAKEAIKMYNLPEGTKAYGDSQGLYCSDISTVMLSITHTTVS